MPPPNILQPQFWTIQSYRQNPLPALLIIRALDSGEESSKLFVVTMVLNTCELLITWARNQGIVIQYIQPVEPQQNAYVERYNRTVRHEWLNQHLFESIDHARETATEWLWRYNNERPNMAIGGITPRYKLKQAA
jgi:putative transposase